ncbi:hypothetical protein J6590_046255 [Homalodisca vitripennis]|nr:hypothetical protein J6590_046255 [Homalodisca vitripennis]
MPQPVPVNDSTVNINNSTVECAPSSRLGLKRMIIPHVKVARHGHQLTPDTLILFGSVTPP